MKWAIRSYSYCVWMAYLGLRKKCQFAVILSFVRVCQYFVNFRLIIVSFFCVFRSQSPDSILTYKDVMFNFISFEIIEASVNEVDFKPFTQNFFFKFTRVLCIFQIMNGFAFDESSQNRKCMKSKYWMIVGLK